MYFSSLPGLVTSQGRRNGNEAACEVVLEHVEQAARKPVQWDWLVRRVKDVDIKWNEYIMAEDTRTNHENRSGELLSSSNEWARRWFVSLLAKTLPPNRHGLRRDTNQLYQTSDAIHSFSLMNMKKKDPLLNFYANMLKKSPNPDIVRTRNKKFK